MWTMQRYEQLAVKAWRQWNSGVFLRKDCTCFRCGRVSYRDHKHFCKAIFARCYSCKKLSHYSRVCRSGNPHILPVQGPIPSSEQAEIVSDLFPDQPFLECNNTELQNFLNPFGTKDFELKQIKAKLQLGQTKALISEEQTNAIKNLEDEVSKLKNIEAEQRETISDLNSKLDLSELKKKEMLEQVIRVANQFVTLQNIEAEQRETICDLKSKLDTKEQIAQNMTEACAQLQSQYSALTDEKDQEISQLEDQIEDLQSQLDQQYAPSFPPAPYPPNYQPQFQNGHQNPMYGQPFHNTPQPSMYEYQQNCAPQFVPNAPRGKRRKRGRRY